MLQVIKNNESLPIKIWASNLEESALEQATRLAQLPFVKKHVVLCADAHSGYGMPIGGVIATQDVVVVNAVGVDIGCGVSAVNTHIKNWNTDFIKEALGKIREVIPAGLNKKHATKQLLGYMPVMEPSENLPPIVEQEFEKARFSLGSLGSGNHFLSLEKDVDGNLWVMLHSGSRNLGKVVADHYNKLATSLNERWYSRVPKEWQLAFLPLSSPEGQQYLEEMNYCIRFAASSRTLMMLRALEMLWERADAHNLFYRRLLSNDEIIDVKHNYAALENHGISNYLIHRKGAIRARVGELGIIPGSMGTSSFIVRGLGNPDSLCSASHGAGRRMSRTAAKSTLSFSEEVAKMDALGIVHGLRDKEHLDEAPGSYKDIHEVMENQKDLVEIVTELTPVANLKG